MRQRRLISNDIFDFSPQNILATNEVCPQIHHSSSFKWPVLFYLLGFDCHGREC